MSRLRLGYGSRRNVAKIDSHKAVLADSLVLSGVAHVLAVDLRQICIPLNWGGKVDSLKLDACALAKPGARKGLALRVRAGADPCRCCRGRPRGDRAFVKRSEQGDGHEADQATIHSWRSPTRPRFSQGQPNLKRSNDQPAKAARERRRRCPVQRKHVDSDASLERLNGVIRPVQ